MKKSKKFVAIIAIVSIALSSAITAYAEDAVVAAPVEDAAPAAEEAPAEEAAPAAEEAPVAPAAPAPAPVEVPQYPDLVLTDKHYYGFQSVDYGVYPESADVKDLAETVELLIWDQYNKFANDFPTFYSDPNSFSVSYSVDNFNRYALIYVDLNFNRNKIATLPIVDPFKFYVDKADYSMITEEQYEAGIAAQSEAVKAAEEAAAAPAADAADEEKPIALMQVRSNCTALGLTLQYDSEIRETLVLEVGEGSDLDVLVKYQIGVNKYIVNDEEIELEAAPVIHEDNFAYVPVSFFTNILKVDVVEKDGVFVVVVPEAE